jgi:hypothetical protein
MIITSHIPIDPISDVLDNNSYSIALFPFNIESFKQILSTSYSNINVDSVFEILNSYFAPFLSHGNESELLQFNMKLLYSMDMDEFINTFDKNLLKLSNSDNTCKYILRGIFIFVAIKYITQFSEVITNRIYEENLMKKINSDYAYDKIIFLCYKYKLCELNINSTKYPAIYSEKEKYKTLDNFYDEVVLGVEKYLNLDYNFNIGRDLIYSKYNIFYANQLSFIHFNEFEIFLCKNIDNHSRSLKIANTQLNLLIGYYVWRNFKEVIKLIII